MEGEREGNGKDGVRYKNVERRRMLNEQHRDEAVEEKVLKEYRGGLRDTLFQLSLVFLSVSSQFSFFLFSYVSEVDSRHQART